ncbi:class I SAM-dependent DNA methyltransferase [Dysgonomonas sp. GY617]|uniref:HsdM family class I SAM-dependent methyltransferase n=1 Tax=Dysgonomonas sp. GY617 TaxID=2780420 RepID=UPI0018848A90|nr:N-6 DNA methylase [Dysgonomonas sp. GY617]MBF0577165.1 N-6 DNA methylase [Dysgonomonas sp. GY617]
MSTSFFYEKLGYEHLSKCSDIPVSNPEYQELGEIGADTVYFSGDFPAILFKEVKAFDIDALKQIAEIQHKAWNYRKIMFLFVVSDTEIRIYNCHEKPKYIKPDSNYDKELSSYQIFSSTKDDETNLKILNEIFSRIGVDSGLLWTSDYNLRESINVQKRIDRYLVESLLKTADALKKDITDTNIIHGLLMRSLFILYLEDKGAAQEAGLYKEIKKDAESYFDILDDVGATYQLFAKLQEHFNGNVFPIIEGEQLKVKKEHLEKIKNCFIDGDISEQPKLFESWRIFKFDFIQIELLSEVYENFLGELDAKREKGQFYTPYTLVELILNDKLPIKNETNHNIKILDPACGSGIFLVESYKRLIRRWENKNPSKVITFKELHDILVQNIFGIEIDPLAIKVTAFSLYLAIVERLNPKKLWIDKTNKFPYLIDNPKDISIKGKEGKNLWCRDTIGEVNPDDFEKVDLVVGNPPFGTKKLTKSIMDYCVKHNFGKEMVLPFLHKSIDFCPDGNIALIFNAKVLTNTEKPFQNFRKWLLNENYVEKVYNLSIFRKIPKNFGGQLFTSAVGPICIAYFQKNTPSKTSNTIEYWAPKTYLKSNLIDGVLIDSTDIKFLPRAECQIPDSKIWKIAMWGNIADYYFLKSLSNSSILKQYIERKKIKKGLGLQFLDNSTKKITEDKTIPQKYILPKHIDRYYTDCFSKLIDGLSDKSKKIYSEHYGISASHLDRIDDFRRLGAIETYKAPHILIKEGLKEWRVCASFVQEECSFNSKVLGLHHDDEKILKGLTCYLNSKLAAYFLFMISASIGIEREELKPNEYYQLPFSFKDDDMYHLSEILDKYLSLDIFEQNNQKDIFENEIDDFIFSLCHISQKEKFLISDAFEYSFSMLIEGVKSKAFHRVLSDENRSYAKILHQELNNFFSETSHKINLTIYDVQRHNPLNLVVLHFCNTEKPIDVNQTKELSSLLKELDKYSIQEKGKNLYIQKQFRYYDRDKIYLIKPNQKRFWTRSQAIDDAHSLIVEIANMETK